MLQFLSLLCAAFACSYGFQHPLVADQAHKDDYQAEQARELLKHILSSNSEEYELQDGRLGFSWDNCGSASDPVQIKSMSLSPDPIVIPGSVTVSVDAVIAETIEAPTSLKLDVKKKLFGVFVSIPCVDNVGSCTYSNPCNLLSNFTCPEAFKEHGFNCRCPIKKNEYKLPPSLIKLPDIKLPSFIENGEYKIQATLMGAERLACYQVDASLKTKSNVIA